MAVPVLAPAQQSGGASLAVAVLSERDALAPRSQREKLAPAARASATEAALPATTGANQAAFNESVKRLRAAEASDPAYALAQYKRFFNERTLTPALGVQVGLKIAQIRWQMGDAPGALATCEVIGAKYAGESSAALFALQKARVLMGRKQLAQASKCVNEAMPDLVALGPSRYAEISDLLLALVQTNLDSGDADGKVRAQILCVNVEEVYLRWMKRDAIDHLWQRFEALEAEYQKADDAKRAAELMPKIVDALYLRPIAPDDVEGAVLSLEAARWLTERGDAQQAAVFYERIPQFGDSWHNGLMRYDRALALMDQGQHPAARALLQQPMSGPRADEMKVGLLSLLSSSYLATGEWALARSTAQAALDLNRTLPHPPQDEGFKYQAQRAREVLDAAQSAENAAAPAEQTPNAPVSGHDLTD